MKAFLPAIVSAALLLPLFQSCSGSRTNTITGYNKYKDFRKEESRSESVSMPDLVSMDRSDADVESVNGKFNTESYNKINENIFLEALKNPLSTFSIDVDTAAYANCRRFINSGAVPYKDAVRIEELVNYFIYNYAPPKGPDPFSITAELSGCPWNQAHRLLLIGLKGREVGLENMPPNNLVFLIDVSGSMGVPNKLPLLKQALKLVVAQMRPIDKISIVVYAGAAGLVLQPTTGKNKSVIMDAIDRLESGGSTAGGEGIILAYQTAKDNFIKNGNNRIILATDGDFNVGASSDAEMERLIEQKRNDGIFLTVLGFGMGNYKDSKMVTLADKGNGNYAYIDTIQEARKVLVQQLGGTLLTIAKDVKIQIEFNPAMVYSYRLIGYEKRLLRTEDFTNDTKDAGELGAGHNVTALYELVLAGPENRQSTNGLKYMNITVNSNASSSGEYVAINFRYKKPDGTNSILIQGAVTNASDDWTKASENFRFASSVAEFGLIMLDSEFKGNASLGSVIQRAQGSLGQDSEGYRKEFIRLVEQYKKNTGK